MVWSICRLYRQLSQDKMPDDATDTVESQVEELQKVATERLILVVLDGVHILAVSFVLIRMSPSDMWDAEHERPFSCIDPATASKLLVVRGTQGDSSRFLLLRSDPPQTLPYP